jgi:hypothetical protein
MSRNAALQAAALWYRVAYGVAGDIWMAAEAIDQDSWYVEIISDTLPTDIDVCVAPNGTVTKVNEGKCKLRTAFPGLLVPENAFKLRVRA